MCYQYVFCMQAGIMRYDEVFNYMGDFGRYQISKTILLNLPAVIVGGQLFSLTFLAAEPDYR